MDPITAKTLAYVGAICATIGAAISTLFACIIIRFDRHPKRASLTIKLKRDAESPSRWVAFVDELHRCHTFGASPKHALENLTEAMDLWTDELAEVLGEAIAEAPGDPEKP